MQVAGETDLKEKLIGRVGLGVDGQFSDSRKSESTELLSATSPRETALVKALVRQQA